ncbi:MAG: hypothetical protein JNN30_05465 [Rhodanobacteraceae bacterium]|nr:hypothetical protein [Rhodanobacteraceae bacterium]
MERQIAGVAGSMASKPPVMFLMDSFRARAHQCLSAARIEMESGDSARLSFAALRLRMALEALTYERAQAYRNHIDPEDSDAWQPKKVLDALLAVDPNADQGGTLAVGLQEAYGVPSRNMNVVGTEHVVSLATVKKHYDALGSFLHLPTIKQLREKGDPKPESVRKHCEAVAAAVERALSSPVWNVVMYGAIDFKCQRCSEPIERAVPLVPHRFVTTCPKCKAAYRLDGEADGPVAITAAAAPVRCHHEACSGEHNLWPDEAKPGTSWTCRECGARYTLVLRTQLIVDEKKENAQPSHDENLETPLHAAG